MKTSYGWVECAGLADRSAYDLTQHARATGVELKAYEHYDEPRLEEAVDVVPQMKVMGRALKGAAKDVAAHLASLESDAALELKVCGPVAAVAARRIADHVRVGVAWPLGRECLTVACAVHLCRGNVRRAQRLAVLCFRASWTLTARPSSS